MKLSKIIILMCAIFITFGISAGKSGQLKQNTFKSAVIVYGDSALPGEKHAAGELAKDLKKVYGFASQVLSAGNWIKNGKPGLKNSAVFYVGTVDTNQLINNFAEKGIIKVSASDPGPEAFIIKTFPETGEVMIAGCDERGTLYGVYEFSSRFLGIDPMEYWTDKKPEKRESLIIPDMHIREDPPVFKLRGYFDNDSDMIANYSGRKLIIEFETWKEMIDSAARLRYNFIDIFDTLGRTEFWVWDFYTERFPGYHTDLELVDQIIDYAHEKGMMVQVSTYLGYEFHPLPRKHNCLSIHHDEWIDAYRYMLEETPVGKADIFYHSPRDPWWDRPYFCAWESAVGIDKGKLHTKLINELRGLIKSHNPEAKFFGLLWSDGKKNWNNKTFNPDPSIDMVWADDGYGRFPSWVDDFEGHNFGIYIHAGFYKNHVMQDPYPHRIKESVLEAQSRGMTEYYFVNGQDFKHFILNLEACGRAGWDPVKFDPDAFYLEWTSRYFGEEAAPLVIDSLKELHEASNLAGGFTNISIKTWLTVEFAKFGIPYCRDFSYIDPAIEHAEKSLELAEKAKPLVPIGSKNVYSDQILFPARIYVANLELHKSVAGYVDAQCDIINPVASLSDKKDAFKNINTFRKQAPEYLDNLVNLLNEGSGWEKWDGWTSVENFRKYQPPPSTKELNDALKLK